MPSKECRVVKQAIMERLVAQADDDLTEASDYCRELRDTTTSQSVAADLRYASERFDEARCALQSVRNRLGL
jgi:hypothetical protein